MIQRLLRPTVGSRTYPSSPNKTVNLPLSRPQIMATVRLSLLCPLWVATSTGRRNTLSENHCLARMLLNQRNSYSFNGTLSAYRWKCWLPCPTDSPIACFDGASIANRLFEISVRPSTTLAAPALTTRLQNRLARRPGCLVSSGCCVDPLRPQVLSGRSSLVPVAFPPLGFQEVFLCSLLYPLKE